MAGILVSPGFDKMVRKHNLSYKKKGGSPSFKEVLRQRCKERFKARRCALLNQFRNINSSSEVKDIICSMVREEAQVLSAGLTYTKPDEMELDVQPLEMNGLNSFEEWLLNEYDQFFEEEMERDINLSVQSICPLCLSSPLTDQCEVYSTCKSCKINLPPLYQLLPLLDSVYSYHWSTGCPAVPSCSVLDKSLCLICTECSNIVNVIDLN